MSAPSPLSWGNQSLKRKSKKKKVLKKKKERAPDPEQYDYGFFMAKVFSHGKGT